MAGRVRLLKIIEQARITFGNNPSKDPFYKQNLEKLKEAMNAISAEDLNLSSAIADKEWVYKAGPDFYKANAACMEIGQCKDFSVAVFLLKSGCGLPLHDHPEMYGCMKVLFGEIEVTSYSTDFDESVPVAFLDILAPPYDPESGRDCTYYYKCNIDSKDTKDKNIVYLRPGSSPPGFLCIPQTYPGPKVEV